MPLARQNAFKPLPTSDSLPTFPSNKPSRSKVSLKILLGRNIFVAGAGKLQGELEISVKDRALSLGEIGIELSGVEELRNRDHTATKRIIYSRLLFQGQSLPPSNAVVAGSSPSQGGYFPALRGRTRFDFSFDLPKDLPSTCSFGANAVVRYELRAFTSSLFEGDVDLKSEKKEVLIVERWDDWRKGNWATGTEKEAEHELKGREGGTVTIKASIGKDESSGSLPRLFWWRDVDEGVEGKGSIELRVRMNNTTKRHIPGVKVSLIRRLRLQRDRNREGPTPPQLSTTVAAVDFLGTDFDVRAGSEREILIALQLPKQECWTGRKATLFDLDCFVRLQVEGAFLESKLFVEAPVWIAHPFSISNTAHRLVESERPVLEIPPSPSVPFLRSPRSTLDFSTASTQQGYAEVPQPHRLGLSQNTHHYAGSNVSTYPASQPYSTPAPQPPLSAPPPPTSFFSSPHPYQLPTPHSGYVTFDPAQPEITPSRFLSSLQAQQPNQVYMSPESTISLSRGPSPASGPPSFQLPLLSHIPPPPSLMQPPLPPLDSHPSRQPSPRNAPNPALPSLPPLEPYSAMSRAHRDWHTAGPGSHSPRSPHDPASPPAAYIPEPLSLPPSCPSPAPSNFPPVPNSFTPRAPFRTPPPPSPSSQFRQQPTSSSVVSSSAFNPLENNALDTIGEDGESQAGTTKSQALTASALAALRGDDDESSSIQSIRVGNSPGRTSVQDLEELVAEEERRSEEEKELEENTAVGTSKTLPTPPTPTKRSTTSPQIAPMRAQDIFCRMSPESADEPSSPPKLSTTSSPSPQLPARSEDGLAALQARLARATSPLQQPLPSSSPLLSRSPSPSKVSPRTTSPALELPNGGTSALRARSISRTGRQRDKEIEKVLQEAEEDPAKVVKKALSRASWSKTEPSPPPNVSTEVFKAVTAMRNLEITPAGQSKVTSVVEEKSLQTDQNVVRLIKGSEPFTTASATRTEEEVPVRISSPPSRPPSRPVFGSSPSKNGNQPTLPISVVLPVPPPIDLSSPIDVAPLSSSVERQESKSPQAAIDERGRKIVDSLEVKELKKEAVLRLGDWLQSDSKSASAGVSPWSSVSKSNSTHELLRKRKSNEFARPAPPPPASTTIPLSPSIVAVTPSLSSPATAPRPVSQEPSDAPTVAQLLASEARAELRRIESSSTEKPSLVAKGLDGFLAATKKDGEFEPAKYHVSSARGGKGGKVTNVASIWASREATAKQIPIPSPVLGHKSAKSLSSIDKPPFQPLSPVDNAPGRTNRRSLQVLPAPCAAKPFLNTTLGKSSSNPGPSSHASSSENTQLNTPGGGAKVKDLLLRYQQQIT